MTVYVITEHDGVGHMKLTGAGFTKKADAEKYVAAFNTEKGKAPYWEVESVHIQERP